MISWQAEFFLHNDSFHYASRNREDAGPARGSGYEAWS